MDSHTKQGDLVIPNTQGALGSQIIPASVPQNIYEPKPLNLDDLKNTVLKKRDERYG